MKKFLMYITWAVFATMLYTACTAEERSITPEKGNDTEEDVTFSLEFPGVGDATKALTGDNEKAVQGIAVLAFNAGKYHYTSYATDITTDPGDKSRKTFKVKLVKTASCDLVLVANAQDLITTNFTKDTPKADVLSALQATAAKWNATPGSAGYKHIPMWGKKSGVEIKEGTTFTGANAIKLARMLAKVNVSIATAAQSDFELTSIRVYNYNNKGRVAPTKGWSDADNKMTSPDVPAEATLTKGPLLYDGTDITTAKVKSEDVIYLFEAVKGTDSKLGSNTCLVLGGTYEGDTYYYRVDFTKKENDKWVYLDLLRNHKYVVSVTAVKGPGFKDPGDAFNSLPVNIEANILEWDEGGMENVAFDGQFYLSVSQDEYNLSKDARSSLFADNVIYVKTDYQSGSESGWKVEKIVNADNETQAVTWVSLDQNTGVKDVKSERYFKVEENTSGSSRKAKIIFAAGRLRYPVYVTQSIYSTLQLHVTDNLGNPIEEMIFSSSFNVRPGQKTFKVNWIPSSSPLTVFKHPMSYYPFPTTAPDITPSLGNIAAGIGTANYTVWPQAMTAENVELDPFYEKNIRLEFQATNGSETVSKELILRQVHYNRTHKPKKYYYLDGNTYSFGVKSNTAWVVASYSDPHGILDMTASEITSQSGGYNVSSGTPFRFKMKADTDGSLSGKSAIITFKDPTGNMATMTTATITGLSCGAAGGATKITMGASGREYLIHAYGGTCWMVENLAEDPILPEEIMPDAAYHKTYDGHAEGERGYYYQWGAALYSCPDGWKLPSKKNHADLWALLRDDESTPGRDYWNVSKTARDLHGGYWVRSTGFERWGGSGGFWLDEDNMYFEVNSLAVNPAGSIQFGAPKNNATGNGVRNGRETVRCILIDEED
ncbi:uncharacterized protein (TIGR02145 family) [Parabacteroides sp. PF5-5]|uniref:FimB/Mfa2 family fimbrial subunit n=1 Tax=unclassified Parabacteroides TaxID=2649774 RepID=UPI0024733938|nr:MULTISPECIES: FISUMP domain-containing protein [unclassified Parabacteroides]MDH6307064.1 uncharacterized protein (TIGR02145 family) [Parabacteroides sp. PH5-39]MDH6317276.1 uncharacterized protein (TIGR02145 family) [Parabacteroides sp. PF5-13]MDH6321720.1 uncharacterized protein (TIGR02145 family) [Parabacteroides sp. PH5-13]MDH6325452.1 uncharacterized protein (TIGR02145 family) [Parabacteroides sp. PH5-8]MDH6328550.1 uncharacterized protein (TIGR02145 family) [Parabacteroides sp. PH5-41